MDNEKWVWADNGDASPLALPALDKKIKPIVEWPDTPAPEQAPPEPPAQTNPESANAADATPTAPSTIQPTTIAPTTIAPTTIAPSTDPAAEPRRENKRPAIAASLVRAIVFHLEGKLEEAIEEIRTGLKAGEPPIDLYAAMGALQMELERFEDAAASYREAIRLDPGNEACKHSLANCERKIEDSKKPPKPSPRLVKAIVLHMEGKLEEAIQELQTGVNSGEQAPDNYAALGHLLFEVGRFAAAAEAYRVVLLREPLHKTCHYNLAVCLEKTGHYPEALASFEKAFEINPDRAEMGIGVGVSLLHLKRYEEALARFEGCLEAHPEDPTGWFGKAFALQCLARSEEAEAAYLELLKRDTAAQEALANLIGLAAAQRKDAQTRQYCEKLLSLAREARIALEALMTLELAAGNHEAACAFGERLTATAPDYFEAWFNLGVARQNAGRAAQAGAAFSEASRLRPTSAEALASLGQALQAQGDPSGAKSAYESALKISPDNLAVLWNLTLVSEQSGNPKEADRLYAQLASRSPNPETVLFRLGTMRFARAEYRASVDAFRSCLKARPDWPAAQYNLGLALWRSGDRDEARQKLEGVGAPPYSTDALSSMALIAVEREDYQAALGYYQRLAECGDRSPERFYNTGLILQNLGRVEEAARQYREAIAVKPDLAEAIQALAQVSNGAGRGEETRKNIRKGPSPAPQLIKSR